MGTPAANVQKEIECVLISDEDDDDVPESKTVTIKSASYSSNDIKVAVDEQSANYLLDDGDGRRVSRRVRKNKNENDDVKNIDQSRSGRNGNDHTNDTYKNSPNSSTANANADKKYGGGENRAETRSRKRERTPSPTPTDSKDNDPIQFKEILAGLEGAAFQSRF